MKTIKTIKAKTAAAAMIGCLLALTIASAACGYGDTEHHQDGPLGGGGTDSPVGGDTDNPAGDDRASPIGSNTDSPVRDDRDDRITISSYPPYVTTPPSIEEEIFKSGTIVRATLISTASGAEENENGRYTPFNKLTFEAHEYLKGDGPDQLEVIVRGSESYEEETTAQEAAEEGLEVRDTGWDAHEGILFLRQAAAPAPAGAAGLQGADAGATAQRTGSTFEFSLQDTLLLEEWEYSVNSLSRDWLPAAGGSQAVTLQSGQVQSPGTGENRPYITDGEESPPPAITLTELREKIDEIKTLQAQDSSPEYQSCIDSMVTMQRYRGGTGPGYTNRRETIRSGEPRNTIASRDDHLSRDDHYHIPWLKGEHTTLFEAGIEDDDEDPTNGYRGNLSATRPLPGGNYTVQKFVQGHNWIPCGYKPEFFHNKITVEVTAPEGTIHEALFDPAAISGSDIIGYDGNSGTLEPAGFANGHLTITKLLWQSGSVIFAVSPHRAVLVNETLQFINVDGATILTLNTAHARSEELGTMTWSVPEKPWADGDQLMLRISRPKNVTYTVTHVGIDGCRCSEQAVIEANKTERLTELHKTATIAGNIQTWSQIASALELGAGSRIIDATNPGSERVLNFENGKDTYLLVEREGATQPPVPPTPVPPTATPTVPPTVPPVIPTATPAPTAAPTVYSASLSPVPASATLGQTYQMTLITNVPNNPGIKVVATYADSNGNVPANCKNLNGANSVRYNGYQVGIPACGPGTMTIRLYQNSNPLELLTTYNIPVSN